MASNASNSKFLLILALLAPCFALPLTQEVLNDILLANSIDLSDKAGNLERFEALKENQEFEIVYPNKLERTKRDIDEVGTKEFTFKAFGQDIHLSLQRKTALLSENFVIQRTHKNGTSSLSVPNIDCLYTGYSLNHEGSRAVMSQCANEAEMFGIITLGEQDIIIKPKLDSLRFTNQNGMVPHFAYISQPENPGECNSNDDEENLDRSKMNIQNAKTKEDPLSVSLSKCLEINIVVDNTVVERHGSQTEYFLLSIMGSVLNLFNDESLGKSLCLILNKIQILEDDVSGLSITSDIENSLNSFCYWQREEDTDLSVLVTRKDLAYGNIYDITGDSMGVGEACNPSSRCAIAEYNGPSGLIFTIAHEIGHLVGMRHDVGDCKEESGEKIMASSNSGGPSAFKWSACSKMYLDDWLRSDQASCLEDISSLRRVKSFKDIPMTGNHLDADQQCKLIYGENARAYQAVVNTKDMCEELKCETDILGGDNFQTNHIPPLDGTRCGKYQSQQCFKGYCMDFYSKFDCGNGDCPNQYVTSDWGSCGADCLRSRTVTCVAIQDDSSEVPVDDAECIAEALEKPDTIDCCCTSGACTNIVSASNSGFVWLATDFGSCTGTCGTGVEERVATCFTILDGNISPIEPDALCGDILPEEQECLLPNPCGLTTVAPDITYEWLVDAFGTCSGICGIGTQERLVLCIISNTNQIVDESLCTESKPATTQSCDTGIACSTDPPDESTYLFLAGGWSECSVTCGVGVETRAVSCVKILPTPTIIVEDDVCLALGQTKPDEQQACILDPCENTYEYYIGAWSTCSVTCGSGIETRSVYCAAVGSATPVDESNCDGLAVPSNSQVCTLDDCTTYTYQVGSWSQCSVTCGDGLELRSVSCIDSVTLLTVDDVFCEAQGLSKPDEAQACSEPTCPPIIDGNFLYFALPWSECNCATQTQTRVVQCVEVDDGIRTATDEECAAAMLIKPDDEQACVPTGCDCLYQVSDWSECSSPCGDGIRTRTVVCECSGVESDESNCVEQGLIKPDTSEICNTGLSCFIWKVVATSECSVTCDEGTLMQTSECFALVNGAEIEVAENFCDADNKPAEMIPCNLGVCIGIWVAGPWSDCTVTCNTGMRMREVDCYEDKSASTMVNKTYCDEEKMPYSEEECNLGPCPSPYGCDMTYTAMSGSLISPEFPNYYPPNLQCDQMIELPASIVVGSTSTPEICHLELEFEFFDLEDSMDCIYDYVMLYDLQVDTSKKYCGMMLGGFTYIPTGDQVQLSFKSDPSVPGIGYNVSWSCVDGPPPTQGPSTMKPPTTEMMTTEKPIETTQEPMETTEMPMSSEATSEAPGYIWKQENISECSVTCGGGMINFMVQCVNEDTMEVVDDSMCEGTAPPSEGECNTTPCYEWVVGIFSECSVPCGMGEQNRSVTCFNPDDNMEVEESLCSFMEKPSDTQMCPTCMPLTMTPDLCTEGPITIQESIVFPDSDANYPNNFNCTTLINSTSGQCIRVYLTSFSVPSDLNCTQDYLEIRDSVGGVSERFCGVFGLEEWISATSNVEIEFISDDSVTDTGYTLIITFMECLETVWATGAYGECSEICGGGNRTRDVTCQNMDNSAPLEDGFCDPAQKPASSEECNTNICLVTTDLPTKAQMTTEIPTTYSWVWPENYTECDVSCGGGFIYKIPFCQDSLGNTVDDVNCDEQSEPNTIGEECNTQSCPIFTWQITPISECSATCGGGNQTVNVTCVDGDSIELNSSYCEPDLEPSVIQPCNVNVACPFECGGEVITSSENNAGSFSSPNHPANYDNDELCEVDFIIAEGASIIFNVDASGIMDTSNICIGDYVLFTSYPSEKSLQVCSGIHEFTSNIGDTVVSFKFVTDEATTGSGFTAIWNLEFSR